ncbi:swi5-dependent recombination DNA repair protein 1 homolog [Scylla paramamosain]|uniref:swi5-dependent recombination DNA repair protein 1 homolog n=1 Tax=Scylla paramamosain TaxID=85552 RepID=UPI003082AB91
MSSDAVKRPQSMGTPNSSQSEEPQPKMPRRSLVEGDVSQRIKEIQIRVQEKKEVLRKLNLAKTYRTKWETQDLSAVTDQWLEVCQMALEDLRARLKEGLPGDTDQPELTLKTLVSSLGIDPELVQLDEEEDCFIT